MPLARFLKKRVAGDEKGEGREGRPSLRDYNEGREEERKRKA
jgi:hypothetical protein